MFKLTKKKLHFLARMFFWIFILTFSSYLLQRFVFVIPIERVQASLAAYGVVSPIVYVLLLAFAVVVVPLPDFVLFIAAGVIFPKTVLFTTTLLGQVIGATVAFFFARRYGLGIVRRFIADDEMSFFERLRKQVNWKIILLLRILPGSNFGLLSFIFGLTEVSYSHYILATIVGQIPQLFLLVYFFDVLTTTSFLPLAFVWILLTIGIPLLIPFLIREKP